MITADPMAWFRSRLIANPSCFILGLPHMGKSSLARHMLIGMYARGITPLILGDLKPDYVMLVQAIGGQVISLGPGRSSINVLDPGATARAALSRLSGRARQRLTESLAARQLTMLTTLIAAARYSGGSTQVSVVEEAVLEASLRLWHQTHPQRVPLLRDIAALIESAPESLRQIVLDREDLSRYRLATDPLLQAFHVLDGHGRFGRIFAEHTSEQMDLTRPVCFDVSSLSAAPEFVKAAALMACWGIGFGAVEAAQALADERLESQKNFFLVMDELWQALRLGDGMVDRLDSLTRLNRNEGVGQAMLTHTMSDLEALTTEEERAKARGLVERSGMVFAGALPQREMSELTKVTRLSQVEQSLLTSWADPGSWGRQTARPGLGNFLIKVGGKPGLPFKLELTEREMAFNDTNAKWEFAS